MGVLSVKAILEQSTILLEWNCENTGEGPPNEGHDLLLTTVSMAMECGTTLTETMKQKQRHVGKEFSAQNDIDEHTASAPSVPPRNFEKENTEVCLDSKPTFVDKPTALFNILQNFRFDSKSAAPSPLQSSILFLCGWGQCMQNVCDVTEHRHVSVGLGSVESRDWTRSTRTAS